MATKKSTPKKKSRPSVRAEEPLKDHEEGLTREEFIERIRKARAAKAGMDYQLSRPRPKKKGPPKPSIPSFDPSLPPVAFPSLSTIGQPIPTGTREGHLRRVKEDRERRLQGLEPLSRESYHPEPIIRISGQNDAFKANEAAFQQPASQKSLDASTFDAEYEAPEGVRVDWKARNLGLSRIIMRNLEPVASAGPKESADANTRNLANRSDMDFSDSTVETQPNPPVPTWDDLHESLRLEITDNLLEQGNWDYAMQKLGLTRKQQKKAEESAKRRHKTIVREDKELGIMREKQLRYLLSVDLSRRKRGQDELVLGNIAARSHQQILDDPEGRFNSCKTSDLRKAWHFLQQHGLPRGLAGNWGNGDKSMQPKENNEPIAKRVKWSHPLATTEGRSVMAMYAGSTKQRSLAEKTAVINHVCRGSSIAGPADTVHPMETLQQHWQDWEQLFTESDENQAHLTQERRLQLALGKDGAAAITANQDGPALPEPAVTQYRFNQRIERAKLDVEAEKRAAEANPPPFTARDITERTWEQKLEARYEKLANDCQKLFLSYESRPDIEYDENSELDEKSLEEVLVEASEFDENLRAFLEDGSNSQSQDSPVNMEFSSACQN